MAKLPSLQFYPGDWKKDPGIQVLSLEEKGAWWEILLAMFESEKRGILLLNGMPYSDDDLSNLLGISAENTRKISKRLLKVGVASIHVSSGALMCRRMVRDEKIRQLRSEVGRRGGKQSASKRQAKPSPPPKQKATSSSSSSISSSDKKEKSPVLSPDALSLCELLKCAILRNDPKARASAIVSFAGPHGWGKDARLMLEKDGRPSREAADLITWATSNTFWKSNILSMGKFREKYTTLKLQKAGEKEEKSKFAVAPQGKAVVDFEDEDFSKAADPDKVRKILRKSPLLGGERDS